MDDPIKFFRQLLKPVDYDEPTKLQERDVRSNPVVATGAIRLLVGCEALPGATGSFGREHSNPIPVNGPIGECVYLSRLRSTSGVGFLFHRLGSLESPRFRTVLDHFELVAIDASEWTELYLSPWHPRRSTQAPFGLSLRTWSSMSKEEQVFCKLPLFGVTTRIENFPEGLPEVIAGEELLAQISTGLGPATARRIAAVLAAHPGKWHRPWERTVAPELEAPSEPAPKAESVPIGESNGLPPVPPSTPPPRRGNRTSATPLAASVAVPPRDSKSHGTWPAAMLAPPSNQADRASETTPAPGIQSVDGSTAAEEPIAGIARLAAENAKRARQLEERGVVSIESIMLFALLLPLIDGLPGVALSDDRLYIETLAGLPFSEWTMAERRLWRRAVARFLIESAGDSEDASSEIEASGMLSAELRAAIPEVTGSEVDVPLSNAVRRYLARQFEPFITDALAASSGDEKHADLLTRLRLLEARFADDPLRGPKALDLRSRVRQILAAPGEPLPLDALEILIRVIEGDTKMSMDDVVCAAERFMPRGTPLEEVVREICKETYDESIEASELGNLAFKLGFAPSFRTARLDAAHARGLLSIRPIRDPFSGRVDRGTEGLLIWLLGEEGREAVEDAFSMDSDTSMVVLERMLCVEGSIGDLIDGRKTLLRNEYATAIRQAVVFGLAVGLIAGSSVTDAESVGEARIKVAFTSPAYPDMFYYLASAACDECDYAIEAINLGARRNSYLVLDNNAASLILAGPAVFLAVCTSCTSLTTCSGRRNYFTIARCAGCGARLDEADLVHSVAGRQPDGGRLAKTTDGLECPRCYKGTIRLELRDRFPGTFYSLAPDHYSLRRGETVHAIADAAGEFRIAGSSWAPEFDFGKGPTPESTDQVVELTILENPLARNLHNQLKVRFERYVQWRSIIGEVDADD